MKFNEILPSDGAPSVVLDRPRADRRGLRSDIQPEEPDGPEPEHPIFETRLRPHRSLSARAFPTLTAVFLVLTFLLIVLSIVRGGWPIIPFLLGNLVLLVSALHVNHRGRLRSEHVLVDRWGVSITGRDHRQRPIYRHHLPLYGLTIERDVDPDYGLRRVRLSLRGRGVEVARDVAPDQRAAFADAFEQALREARCPPRRLDRRGPIQRVRASS